MYFGTRQELSDWLTYHGFGEERAGISSWPHFIFAVVYVMCRLDGLSWEIYLYKLQREYVLC